MLNKIDKLDTTALAENMAYATELIQSFGFDSDIAETSAESKEGIDKLKYKLLEAYRVHTNAQRYGTID